MTQDPATGQTSNPTSEVQDPTKAGLGPGQGLVNKWGIIVIAGYVVVIALFSAYLLIKIWPRCLTSATPSLSQGMPVTPPAPVSGTQPPPVQVSPAPAVVQPQTIVSLEPQCKKEDPQWTLFFWRAEGYWIWEEVRLLLIVFVCGILGGILHVVRSLFWYVGNRDLRWSWVLMYILLPFSGALLALAFYLVIRGGFFPQAKADQGSPIGFAALALLVGLFSAQAGVKLKAIFESVFSPPPDGADAHPQEPQAPAPTAGAPAPKISGVSFVTGKVGEIVTITGTNFSDGPIVKFGDKLAAVEASDATTIKAKAPDNTPGPVPIAVTNKDGQTATTPKDGFTYK